MGHVTSSSYAVVGTRFHFTQDKDPRLPSLACDKKSDLNPIIRLFHAAFTNFIELPLLGLDRVLYASTATATLGVDLESIKRIFSNRTRLESLAHTAQNLLRTIDAAKKHKHQSCQTSPETLFKKIVQIALPYFLSKFVIPGTSAWSHCDWKKSVIVVSLPGRVYLFSIRQLLASSHHANFYGLIDQIEPASSQRYVLKLACDSNSGMEKEYDNSCRLNCNGPTLGVQLPPLMSVTVEKPNQSRMCFGYITHVYPSRGSERTFDTWAKQKEMMGQLVKGLTYLHDVQQAYHLDIKPDHILIDDEGRCDLGDIKRVRFFSSLSSILEKAFINQQSVESTLHQIWEPGSKDYVNHDDESSCMNTIRFFFECRISLDQAAAQLTQLMKLCDIYALARTFYEMLTRNFSAPFILEEKDWSHLSDLLYLSRASRLEIKQVVGSLRKCLVVNPAERGWLCFKGFENLKTFVGI